MDDAARIVLSLVAVAGSCLGTAWLARRSRGVVRHGLRIVSRVAVSKGSSLLVVSVGNRMLLVGAAEGSLQLISELDPADLEPAPAGTPERSPVPPPPEHPASKRLARRSPISFGSTAFSPATAAAPRAPALPLGPIAIAAGAPALPFGPIDAASGATALSLALESIAASDSTASVRPTDGPWTGLVRNLQRMTLRTAPEGPFRARKR